MRNGRRVTTLLVYVRTPTQGRESSSRRRVRLRTHTQTFKRAPHLPSWSDRRGPLNVMMHLTCPHGVTGEVKLVVTTRQHPSPVLKANWLQRDDWGQCKTYERSLCVYTSGFIVPLPHEQGCCKMQRKNIGTIVCTSVNARTLAGLIAGHNQTLLKRD
jgi:hypothetical protein